MLYEVIRVSAAFKSGSCAGIFSFNAVWTASDLPPITTNCFSSIMLPSKEILRITSYNVCYTKLLRWATAAVDVSDGLSGDLRHICEESRVGADINLSALPLSPACRAYAKSTGQNPVTLALAGGEDYELLFTVASRHRRRFERLAARNNFV